MSIYTANVFWAEKARLSDLPMGVTAGRMPGRSTAARSCPPRRRRRWCARRFLDPSVVFIPRRRWWRRCRVATCCFSSISPKQRGFAVESYADDAEGVVEKGADGRIQMTRVTLKPFIVFSSDKRPTEIEVEAIHHKAHEACYIANSVKSEDPGRGLVRGAAAGLNERDRRGCTGDPNSHRVAAASTKGRAAVRDRRSHWLCEVKEQCGTNLAAGRQCLVDKLEGRARANAALIGLQAAHEIVRAGQPSGRALQVDGGRSKRLNIREVLAR